jgi:gliding motility-associated protein GldM
MSGKNETPRQKMIGMMYLILTALLALNVSKDVLDSFIVVNKGLEKTNENFTAHNDELYAQFNLAKSVDPVRVTPNWKKAQDVKLQAAKLISYIDDIQNKLVAETDGVSTKVADTLQMANINSKDNYDIPTNVMIGNTEDGSNGLSHELKNKLVDYRKVLGNYILPIDRKKVEIGIDTENPPDNQNNENWEVYNFFHRPLVASITILSKLKNDVKNAESTVVDYLLKQVDEGSLKFDTIAAKVVPQSNYVLLGEEYKADLFLAAFNKTRNPEIQVGGSKINVDRGLGKYNVRTSREGIVSYSGTVKVVAPSGKEMLFPFKSEYIVARPALTVSADNMNVFYAGLDNPVSVSVPGIPNERLSVSIDNGKITPLGNGKFNVTVPTTIQAANIAVVATMENGEKRNMGASAFRVKRIPKPLARYAGLTADGSLTKDEIAANPGIIAYYDNFIFNANPRVTGFVITIISAGAAEDFIVSNSNMFDKKIKDRVDKLKRGDKFYINEIKAIGPDMIPVKLSGLMIKVK